MANINLYLYMLQRRETKGAKIKIADLSDKLKTVKLSTGSDSFVNSMNILLGFLWWLKFNEGTFKSLIIDDTIE